MTYNTGISNKQSSKLHQVILLDEKGMICESCDSIFDTATFRDVPVSQYFYFLESEFNSILKSEASKITFSQIQTQQNCLPGFYDFVFSKQIIDDQTTIIWDIFDYTPVYKKYLKIQQVKNELDIQKQFKDKKTNRFHKSNGASAQFFQADYKSKNTRDSSFLSKKLLNSKNDVFDLLLGGKEIESGIINLHHLRGHLDVLIEEISLFLDEIKKQESETFEIKTLMDSLLNNDKSQSNVNLINIVYHESVPKSIKANKSMFMQIITLLSKDEITQEFYQNAALKVEYDTYDENNKTLSLKYTEQIIDKSTFEENATKRIIKLSVLKSLIAMSGGALTSNYSDTNPIFDVFITLPLK